MTKTPDQQTIEINIPSKIGYERIAMESSASLAELAGLMPARIDDLKSAVAEACINAMQHGNQWRPEARVIVKLQLSGGRFIVSVTDQGNGVPEIPDYPGIRSIVENNAPSTGLGVFMIRNLVDEVRFNQSSDCGHKMIMEIKLPG
jgi:serine/threonine-protein kinase RsbW